MDLKSVVTESITKEKQRKRSSSSIPGLTKQGLAVFNELVKFDEDIALRFRQVASRETLVRSLYESLNSENFFEIAKEMILKQVNETDSTENKQITLTRICWCLLSP